jgi:hypothetical protein
MNTFIAVSDSELQMTQSNPMLQSMMQSNPYLQGMLQNPEFMQQLANPQTLNALMQLQSAMQQLQGTGFFNAFKYISPLLDIIS